MSVHWHAFHDRVLQPILEATDPPSLPELCRRHGIADPAKASNMIVTVKRRFQDTIRRHIRQSHATEADVSWPIPVLTLFSAWFKNVSHRVTVEGCFPGRAPRFRDWGISIIE